MKKLVLAVSVFACLAFTAASCKKKKTEPAPDYKALLTTGSWVEVKRTTVVSGQSTTETPVACDADDFTTYNTNGTGVFDEGATVCNSGDPQTTTLTYVLSSDGKTITVTKDGFTLSSSINELTSTKLVVTIDLGILGVTTTEFKQK